MAAHLQGSRLLCTLAMHTCKAACVHAHTFAPPSKTIREAYFQNTPHQQLLDCHCKVECKRHDPARQGLSSIHSKLWKLTPCPISCDCNLSHA
eukprot:268928-Pelagomonas_calceolata.AAC.1